MTTDTIKKTRKRDHKAEYQAKMAKRARLAAEAAQQAAEAAQLSQKGMTVGKRGQPVQVQGSRMKFTCGTCRANAWGKPALLLICSGTSTAEHKPLRMDPAQ